ncbi:hypothetical protein Pat9b_5084 (plasmid) [Pantoea sp. At-9b]|nr:hypothetical protein Pat9b_5084 [Pantoea sp. At-9b]
MNTETTLNAAPALTAVTQADIARGCILLYPS